MEESQTSCKKRRRNSAEKLLAKQKDYTFSSEDLLTLDHWEQTLKNQRTRSTYIGAILLVCDYYRKPIHEITPEEWVLYVNSVMPDQIVKREISVSTSRIRYWLSGFLQYESSIVCRDVRSVFKSSACTNTKGEQISNGCADGIYFAGNEEDRYSGVCCSASRI